MSDIADIINRARRYAEARSLSPSTVSRLLFGNGKRLSEIEGGGSLRVDTLERARTRLAELERAPQ